MSVFPDAKCAYFFQNTENETFKTPKMIKET